VTFWIKIPNQTAAADPLRGQQSLNVREKIVLNRANSLLFGRALITDLNTTCLYKR
jgi:hypothetical protein